MRRLRIPKDWKGGKKKKKSPRNVTANHWKEHTHALTRELLEEFSQIVMVWRAKPEHAVQPSQLGFTTSAIPQAAGRQRGAKRGRLSKSRGEAVIFKRNRPSSRSENGERGALCWWISSRELSPPSRACYRRVLKTAFIITTGIPDRTNESPLELGGGTHYIIRCNCEKNELDRLVRYWITMNTLKR